MVIYIYILMDATVCYEQLGSSRLMLMDSGRSRHTATKFAEYIYIDSAQNMDVAKKQICISTRCGF